MKGIIEGLLYVQGDLGLTIEQVSEILEIDIEEAKQLILSLKQDYIDQDRGLRINYLGNSFKLTTKEEHKEYFKKLLENPKNNTLSNAALETLAIVAYNPKITRAEIEAIRGVSADACVYKLLEYGLIEEAGKIDLPGKPMSYKTTNEFLRMFGYTSLEDLPELPRYKLDENKQIVIDDLIEEKEKAPEPSGEELVVEEEE